MREDETDASVVSKAERVVGFVMQLAVVDRVLVHRETPQFTSPIDSRVSLLREEGDHRLAVAAPRRARRAT